MALPIWAEFVGKLSDALNEATESVSWSGAKSKLPVLLTMPVAGSTRREIVSTAMTCEDSLFHGQYFRQFAVETSFHE